MAKSHKTCMEQAEIIDTFGTYQILTLVRRTHALITGNSQSNQDIHKETSTPGRSVWEFSYPCASSTHGTWGTVYITTLSEPQLG